MSKYRELIELFNSELHRLAGLDIKEIGPLDVVYTIPHPTGKGSLIYGQKGAQYLAELSELGVNRSCHQGSIDSRSVYKELLHLVVVNFLKADKEINDKECDRIVAKAVKRVARRKRGATHYVPCHLFSGTESTGFSIGPVKFCKREAVLEQLEPTLIKYLEAAAQNSSAPLLEQDLKEYWDAFDWIAAIAVSDSDPERSRVRAKKMVESSVNCLHLLLGERNSKHIRVGDPNFPRTKSSQLSVDAAGRADIATSIQWRIPHFPEGWLKTVLDSQGQYYEHLMSIALEVTSAPKPPHPHLAQRFLDAAYWFAQGVREESDGAAIVNYVTAIERVLTTKKQKDQTETIKKRGPILVRPFPGETREDVIKRFSKAYAIRSDLVHGSVSPFESKLPKHRSDIAVLTRLTLLGALAFFGTKGLRAAKFTEKDLDRAYDETVAESAA